MLRKLCFSLSEWQLAQIFTSRPENRRSGRFSGA
jgi:hypothetical protein